MNHDPALLELLPLLRRHELITARELERRARARLRIRLADARSRVALALAEGILEEDQHGALRVCYREHQELLST